MLGLIGMLVDQDEVPNTGLDDVLCKELTKDCLSKKSKDVNVSDKSKKKKKSKSKSKQEL